MNILFCHREHREHGDFNSAGRLELHDNLFKDMIIEQIDKLIDRAVAGSKMEEYENVRIIIKAKRVNNYV